MGPLARTCRMLTGLIVAVAVVALAPAAPASAATTYTWTGNGDFVHWSDAANWSPTGVPGNGDSVVIGSIGSGPSGVYGIPPVTLASLTVSETANNVYLGNSVTDGTITVTGAFLWSGGDIGTSVTIGPTATGTIVSGSTKHFGVAPGQALTAAGSLALDDISPTGDNGVLFWFDSDLVVAAGGTLTATGQNVVASGRCCTGHTSTLVNHGDVVVQDGRLLLRGLAWDQLATTSVAQGAVLEFDGGAVRSVDATYAGGGTVLVTDTPSPSPDPAQPTANQGGFQIQGTNHLEGGAVQIATGSWVTGSGSVLGQGSLVLAGGSVVADLVLGEQVLLTTLAGTSSRLDQWDDTSPGYQAHVVAPGTTDVTAGSALVVASTSALTIPAGGALTVPNGATLSAGGCCLTGAQVVLGGRLDVGGGTGNRLGDPDPGSDPALVDLVDLGGDGTVRLVGTTEWDLDPGHHFAGLFTGSGQVLGDVPVRRGTLRPTGATGVSGDLKMVGQSTLEMKVSGSGRPHAVGPLDVAGQVVLDGTLEVRSAKNWPAGKRVTILRFDSNPGASRFASIHAPGWKVSYGQSSVSLVAR